MPGKQENFFTMGSFFGAFVANGKVRRMTRCWLFLARSHVVLGSRLSWLKLEVSVVENLRFAAFFVTLLCCVVVFLDCVDLCWVCILLCCVSCGCFDQGLEPIRNRGARLSRVRGGLLSLEGEQKGVEGRHARGWRWWWSSW